MNNKTKYQGIITLWAVAECGLGGIMHALKIPFTGIVVGSISVICLYFIAKYSEQKTKSIIEATATVLMIKLLASPHSPWQAYVAVSFQALMAIVLLSWKKISTVHIFAFTIITQLESAVQRILIMVLVFGNDFISALDKAIIQIIKWMGISYEGSLVWPVFLAYVALHLLTGIVLGFWIPGLEGDVDDMKKKEIVLPPPINAQNKKRYNRIWFVLGIGLLLPLTAAWILNDKSLVYVFLRVLVITMTFIFILTPIIKYFIKRFTTLNANQHQVDHVITQLPELVNDYARYIKWANINYSGLAKIKHILVAILYASIYKVDVKS